MSIVQVPIYTTESFRSDSTAKDSRFKNCFLEVAISSEGNLSSAQRVQRFFATKRFGVSQHLDTGYVAEGRGIVSWRSTLFSVIGDRVFAGTGEISFSGNRLATTTSPVQFSKVANNGGVVIKAANELWQITPSTSAVSGYAVSGYAVSGNDSITQFNFAKLTDADIPGNLVHGVVYLDQYTFVGDAQGYIYNSALADVTSWTQGERLLAQLESDQNVAIVKHLNYLVALGEWTTEFFYDAANPQGSPLLPLQGSMHHVGCAAGATVFADEDTVIWLGKSKSGGLQVVVLNGMQVQPISNPYIEKIIAHEEATLSTVYAWGGRIQGHLLYFLTLPTLDKTFVYNLSTQTWSEFTSYTGSTESYFKYIGFTELAGQYYTLHRSDGKIGKMDFDLYTDYTGAVQTEVVTNKISLGTVRNKVLRRLIVLGDAATSTSTVTVDWTDDDYITWSTARTVDLSKTNPSLYALGRFQRRAFRLKHTGNVPLRIEGLELNISENSYEGGNR